MKLKKTIFFLSFVCFSLFIYTLSPSLDLLSPAELVTKLTSSEFKGRGYRLSGERKAAELIREQFKKIGLTPLASDYFQKFSFNVNVFPKEPKLQISGKALQPGIDFLPTSSSQSGKGEGKLLFLKDSVFTEASELETALKLDFSNRVLVYNARFESKSFTLPQSFIDKRKEAKAALLLTEPLIFSVSQKRKDFTTFLVLKDALSAAAQDASISFEVESTLLENYETQNVIGTIKGTKDPDSYLGISAHYDHLGAIGDSLYFPGGNDNASGVAALVELAKYYQSHPPDYSVVFFAFSAEEAGLVGSKFYVENPLFPLEKIDFLVNLDLFATGEDGMMAVNGAIYPVAFSLLSQINASKKYLPAIHQRGKAPNSDHYYFSENGVPCFFFYLEGKSWSPYHHVNDTGAIPFSRFQESLSLIRDFNEAVMKLPRQKSPEPLNRSPQSNFQPTHPSKVRRGVSQLQECAE